MIRISSLKRCTAVAFLSITVKHTSPAPPFYWSEGIPDTSISKYGQIKAKLSINLYIYHNWRFSVETS